MPPSASSKRPFLRRLRAGERAFFVAEELRFDQVLRQRRAAHLDERLLRARRVVVDRVGDQLLAGAGLAAQQHGRVGARDLRDLLVDLPHRAARADDVREVVALFQLLAQVRVLVDEPLPVGLDQPVHLHRLRDHRADDAEELDGAVVVAIRLEAQVDADGADGLAFERDRRGDVGQLLLGELGPLRRAVEELRLAADPRHDDRLAALHDLAGDALAQAIAHRACRGRSRPADACSSTSPVCSFSSTTVLRTAPWCRPRISRTRCRPASRSSVADKAWLASSSVDSFLTSLACASAGSIQFATVAGPLGPETDRGTRAQRAGRIFARHLEADADGALRFEHPVTGAPHPLPALREITSSTPSSCSIRCSSSCAIHWMGSPKALMSTVAEMPPDGARHTFVRARYDRPAMNGPL